MACGFLHTWVVTSHFWTIDSTLPVWATHNALSNHLLCLRRNICRQMGQPVATSLTCRCAPYLDLRIVLAEIIEVVPETRGLRRKVFFHTYSSSWKKYVLQNQRNLRWFILFRKQTCNCKMISRTSSLSLDILMWCLSTADAQDICNWCIHWRTRVSALRLLYENLPRPVAVSDAQSKSSKLQNPGGKSCYSNYIIYISCELQLKRSRKSKMENLPPWCRFYGRFYCVEDRADRVLC